MHSELNTNVSSRNFFILTFGTVVALIRTYDQAEGCKMEKILFIINAMALLVFFVSCGDLRDDELLPPNAGNTLVSPELSNSFQASRLADVAGVEDDNAGSGSRTNHPPTAELTKSSEDFGPGVYHAVFFGECHDVDGNLSRCEFSIADNAGGCLCQQVVFRHHENSGNLSS